jgi:hypothetical protein
MQVIYGIMNNALPLSFGGIAKSRTLTPLLRKADGGSDVTVRPKMLKQMPDPF